MKLNEFQSTAAEAISSCKQIKLKLKRHDLNKDNHYQIINPHWIIRVRKNGQELLRGVVIHNAINSITDCDNIPLSDIVKFEILDTTFDRNEECGATILGDYEPIFPVFEYPGFS
jgi:hypothetical protein